MQVIFAILVMRRSHSQSHEGDVDSQPDQYNGNGKMRHGQIPLYS
jgi:hypothetical protein